MAALHHAARELAISQTEADLVNVLAAQMRRLCGDRIWVAFYEAAGHVLDMRYWLMDGERVPEWEVLKPAGTGLGGEVARFGITIAARDYVSECRARGLSPDGPAPEQTRLNMPWVGVPLLGRDRVLGVLCAFKRQGEPFDSGLIEVLETLAAHGSTALENVRLRAEEVARRAELERRAAELQDSELRYRRLVELSPDAIVVHVGGVVVYVNRAAEHMFGASAPEQLLGARVIDLVHPDAREGVLRRLRQLQTPDAAVPAAEEKLLRLDGSTIEAEIAAAAVVYEGQAAIQVVARDISERKRSRELLQHQALHDGLTGLPNRRLFNARSRELLTAETPPCSMAVLFIDLDDFKKINDTLSHEHGDLVLHETARRLRMCVRTTDTVARLGGDEFAVLLNGIRSTGQARRTAARLQRVLTRPISDGTRNIVVGVSIGMAFNDRTNDADLLLRNADLAMYEAKSGGKNRSLVFDARLERRLVERLDFERELQGALERDELELHYQPIYHLQSNCWIGAEALLRWHHPSRGMIAPDRFIPIAESSGSIVAMGRWVLEQACRQLRTWQYQSAVDAGKFELSVNLSGRQLRDPRLAADVARALTQHGIEPGQLVLEVTESTAMTDVRSSLQSLQQLKSLGVRLAIDDFGTGYSSLSHLKHFPIDILKIDRSFVRGLGSDDQDEAIVRSIVAVAKSLGLAVTAEGVETAAQRTVLRELGCDFGQGYLLGRPAPPELLVPSRSKAA